MRHKHFSFNISDADANAFAPLLAMRFHRRGFGFGGGFGGFGGSWGRSTKRGDIKYLVLEALSKGPRHGYDVITNIEERYGSRPSAGSIYPTLQMLEDAGHVTSSQEDGKRVYTITDSGRELLEKRPAGDEDEDLAEDARHRVRSAIKRLMMAVMGARGSGDVVLDKVAQTLEAARKEIYTLLSSERI